MSARNLRMEFRVPLRGHQGDESLHLERSPVSLSDFMSLEPRSSYTSFLSTHNATKLFHLDFHCERLIKGLETLEPTSRLPSSLELKAVLGKSVASIVRFYTIPAETELQLVVILRRIGFEPHLRIHASLVPSMKLHQDNLDFVTVECQKGQRLHPAVKNTSWYCERIPFEQIRSKTAHETILVGDDAGVPVLLEGLITNFFVVTDDLEVWTAAENFVLSGSMRDLVLQACGELEVKAVERAIPLRFWRKYEAAFLTNARQLLQPVSTIEVPPSTRKGLSGVPGIITLPEESVAVDLVKRLKKRVIDIIERIVEDIF